MLASSCKSRFAAIALISLGVSTLSGTSAGFATGTDESDSAVCEETPSTISATSLDFGKVPKDSSSRIELMVTIDQGQTVDCDLKNAFIGSVSIGDFTGGAHLDLGIRKVVVSIAEPTDNRYPLIAVVPVDAEIGSFGATLVFVLEGG